MEINLKFDKKCSTCGDYFPLETYSSNKQSKDGKYHKCKNCEKLYRDANKLRMKEVRRLYYQNNKEAVKKAVNAYRLNNIESIKIKKNKDYYIYINRSLLRDAKKRAKQKGILFDLILDDIIIPNVCPVLNIPIVVGGQRGPSSNSPSIDRIDSEKGYTKDNIKIISWRANRLKSDATVGEVKLILNYMEDNA